METETSASNIYRYIGQIEEGETFITCALGSQEDGGENRLKEETTDFCIPARVWTLGMKVREEKYVWKSSDINEI